MANTYKRILLHIVFAVKRREALLQKEWRGRLFEYIAGIINERKHYSYAVNGHFDHIHIFFDYKGHELIEDLVREIKKSSNTFINNENLSPKKFEWQSGYGVFSHGYSDRDTVIKYVMNQENHHKKKTFREEYFDFLKKNEIEFKDEYVFEFFDD